MNSIKDKISHKRFKRKTDDKNEPKLKKRKLDKSICKENIVLIHDNSTENGSKLHKNSSQKKKKQKFKMPKIVKQNVFNNLTHKNKEMSDNMKSSLINENKNNKCLYCDKLIKTSLYYHEIVCNGPKGLTGF